jgi:hypothetical protein
MKKYLLIGCLILPMFAMASENLRNYTFTDTTMISLIIQNLDKKETSEYSRNISRILRLNYRADLQKDLADYVVNQVQNNKRLNEIAQAVNPSSTTLFNKSYTDYIKIRLRKTLLQTTILHQRRIKNFSKAFSIT